MKPIYKNKTSFDVFISIKDNVYNVAGTYYYAPNEIYGEPPNQFTQDDSELNIKDFYRLFEDERNEITHYVNLEDWLEFDEFYKKVSELVWNKLLDSDWE